MTSVLEPSLLVMNPININLLLWSHHKSCGEWLGITSAIFCYYKKHHTANASSTVYRVLMANCINLVQYMYTTDCCNTVLQHWCTTHCKTETSSVIWSIQIKSKYIEEWRNDLATAYWTQDLWGVGRRRVNGKREVPVERRDSKIQMYQKEGRDSQVAERDWLRTKGELGK